VRARRTLVDLIKIAQRPAQFVCQQARSDKGCDGYADGSL
jgi:hypothetical protein